MFQQATLTLLGFVLLGALIFGQTSLALLTGMLLVTAGLARIWSRWALVRVAYERQLSQTRAFPGDELTLTIKVTNRKLLPLARLQVDDELPGNLQIEGGTEPRRLGRSNLLQRRTSLRWYESIVWRYRIRLRARGAYRLGPVQLRSGDPFGLYDCDATLEVFTPLLVYPRFLPVEELGLPARNPLGDLRAPSLLRDPLRTIGVRDYSPTDPLKDVHWAATARTGKLQSRVYEPATSRTLVIFLDLDTFEFYYEGIDPEQVERMISAAATVARLGLEARDPVGLYVNGMPAEHEHLAHLPPGRSPAQFGLMMETLARLTTYSVMPIGRLLNLSATELPLGATVLLIGCVNSEGTRAALLRLRTHGYQVTWLYMGTGQAPVVPGVKIVTGRSHSAAVATP
ncbi:DUF58 domain-containing protein [Candidatus Chloroploca asiatica]|uniref:DUF58 domain-containing protein n=1 Tax=Candidatus Chloroploca asiatica TaxID=1506545 RepID=A0A2H3KY07_9CHLR|nr:DUF58 domain-containing protein [Candidatus Chloroploca asiatica]PDV98868.1 hypothetical protein A9Q02_02760 [Candidatus Chloroploca asiatica]